MAYAQRNYPKTIQGIRGRYTIAQIGCFVTAFCNLQRRLKTQYIAPDQFNKQLVARGIYIDIDDGIRDDLGWSSITQYNKYIQISALGSTVKPPNANAIVRIKAGNRFGTHFCLVDKIVGNTVYIVDSWDGAVKKSSVYGPITGWATYVNKKPVAVTPVKPAPKPTYVTVKKGQFLSLIARLNKITLGRLLQLNPKYRSNPNFVEVGDKVRTK